MDSVTQIKSKLDIVDIVGSYISLKKSGRNYKANCPFHGEKTPSFMVSPELQIYKCFGCAAAGDMFNFIQEIEGIDFVQALEQLAERAGIELEKTDYDKTSLQKKKIFEINQLTTTFYQHLLQHPSGKNALKYLTKTRKLTKQTIETFKLGYAPQTWDLLYKYLTKKGYTPTELLDAGVVTKKYSGQGYIDKFRNRIVFPLTDITGKTIGYTARALEDNEPKYLNSPETLVFHKHTYLYGLEKARINIKTEGAVFVEGQVDVISAYQNGIQNVIASSGTSITPEQLQLLKRYTDDLTFCLDSDNAGIKAIYRAITLAEHQNFNIKVAVIPSRYKDLDEVLKDSPDAAKKILSNAVSAYDFFIADKLKRHNKSTAEGKKHIVNELKPLLSKISNKVLFETYLKELSTELDIDASTLKEIIKINKPFEPSSQENPEDAPESIKNNLETYFFAMLIKSDVDVIKAYMYNFDPKEWVDSRIKLLLQRLVEFTQDEVKKFNIEKYLEQFNKEEQTFIKTLYLQDIEFGTKELEDTLTRIHKKDSKEEIKRLTAKIKIAEKQKDQKKVKELSERVTKLMSNLL